MTWRATSARPWSQAECAHLRAQLHGANAAAAPAYSAMETGSSTVGQMQKLLDAAREERQHERQQAGPYLSI